MGALSRRAALLAAVLLSPACVYLRAAGPSTLPTELDELSGLTRSYATSDWLWAHNDSGDVPRLFRIGLDGRDGGTVDVPQANAVDWEDIAAFRWQERPMLLIGDIGDNRALRSAVTLYAVQDPGAKGESAALAWQLDFVYPNGPRDAEGLAVDPLSNDILVLSKRERPPVLYRLPMPTTLPKPGKRETAELIGPVLHLPKPTPADSVDDPLFGHLRDWPTALSVSPDGLTLAVTTYKDAYLYRRTPGEPWSAAIARVPVTLDLPQWKQTEAGTFTADGQTFCAGSERRAGFACLRLPPPAPDTSAPRNDP